MSLATEQELKNMVSDLDNVESDTILLYMADAQAQVVAHGIAESDDRFSECHRFLTLHLMGLGGVIAKDVASESVADVSITYTNGSGALKSLYSTNWEREFYKSKTSILGMTDICL